MGEYEFSSPFGGRSIRSGAGGEHAASAVAAVGAPAGGDVEPLDPHRRRVRRGKTVAAAAIATAIAVGGDVVVAVAVKNREADVRGGGVVVALVEQEVRVVDERVVGARRRRPAEQRPAPFLVLSLAVFALPFSLLCGVAGGVEEEGGRAKDEVGAAGMNLHPPWTRRAQHRRDRRRLPISPAAGGGGGGRRRLDEQPPHRSGRHILFSSPKFLGRYPKSDTLGVSPQLNIATNLPVRVLASARNRNGMERMNRRNGGWGSWLVASAFGVK